jgi:hypothetical protein
MRMTKLTFAAMCVVWIGLSALETVDAANFVGASGNWSTAANWSIVAPATEPAVPAAPDDATINRGDDVTVTVDSAVPQLDQFQTQNTNGDGGNTITLEINPGAVLEMTNYSRIGRAGTTTGDTSQILMTGGRFAQVANDFHFGWDPPSPSTIYFEVSGGTFDVFDEFRIGQNRLGNAINPGTPEEITNTAPDKLEFHVKGSGATIQVGELHFESNPAAVDPWMGVVRFSLDQGGASTIVVDGQGDSALGRVTFEDSAALALNILDANVPSNVTLISSVTPNTGTLKNLAGTVLNAGDQISAGNFGGMEYLYNVYFDSNFDTTGTPGVYLTNLQTMPAEGLPGDYNGDDTVDAADYTVWRDHLASGVPLPNNDDTPGVDQGDYDRWKTNFGMSLGGTGAVQAASVPEPASWAILLVAALLGSPLCRPRINAGPVHAN